MADILRVMLTFILSNYSLSFFILGLIFSLAAIIRSRRLIDCSLIVEKLISWYIFFSIGLGNYYNFVIHAFFGEMAAKFIGWADSPFQFEVGAASLGFAVVGLLAAFGSFDLRLAAILGPGIFLLGAAAGHVYQMVTAHNFAPGNAGVIFWTDIFIPLFGFLLLYLHRQNSKSR
ncbi:hypothetical protein QEV83_02070 [Methylocapsa sp. D3K7]|uniref:DUF6790 family protein n=1 Tax=Methylocapsa sp. D3K7 TaxID=3041435 RepID=UPI00244ED5D0|nr:DUF6790 family protein [Methylocapsa sp. D3K7]WGJ15118.1 hypothetical protein QEV83_02070 [Methylocapsa sp. D3K7]